MVLTVNMEGGGGAALAKLILSFHGVFPTVVRGGAAYLQAEHVLGTADSKVGCSRYLQTEPTLALFS